MDEKRRDAWEAAITKKRRGEDVSLEEHCALLREEMFSEGNKVDINDEADFFLDYWLYGIRDDPIPWLGETIPHVWFQLRHRDVKRSDEALRDFVAADDFDHWTALNLIAARLHRTRQPFPDALADWAAELHEDKRKPPPKERGHEGGPPYAQEDRNRLYYMADDWLRYYGMTRADDRVCAIHRYTGDDAAVIQKGLTRWRQKTWRRAPWFRG